MQYQVRRRAPNGRGHRGICGSRGRCRRPPGRARDAGHGGSIRGSGASDGGTRGRWDASTMSHAG